LSKRRVYPWKGSTVNPDYPAPRSPGDWVSEEECETCKARWPDQPKDWKYKLFRSSASFAEEARAMRCREEGGNFISRGPVLWRMRVRKLTEWYQEHAFCGFELQAPAEYDTSELEPIPF
jgi:hypothetical protein